MKTVTIRQVTYDILVDLLQTQITTAQEDAAVAAGELNAEECERNHALANELRQALYDLIDAPAAASMKAGLVK